MLNRYANRQLSRLLGDAGIAVNGDEPWDMQVNDPRCGRAVMLEGSLGMGDAYLRGWWDCERLDEFFYRLLGYFVRQGSIPSRRLSAARLAAFLWFNLQRRSRSFAIGERHYDIGNDLFARMLDSRMNYSCGYWKDAEDLEQAQEAKLRLCCDKLQLAEGMRVLDIGCGWGGAMRYMAERHGVQVTGVTVSAEQLAVAEQRCAGLDCKVLLQDYRDLSGQFDRIYSIGMFEHVGHRNYRGYMQKARSLLADDGLFLLHTICGNRAVNMPDLWIERHIFPNGMLPSLQQIAAAAEGVFVMEDWHNFGPDYARTLMAWQRNCESAWDALGDRYDARFRRMWRYYLQLCAGAFGCRGLQLWQVVLSPAGTPRAYRAPR